MPTSHQPLWEEVGCKHSRPSEYIKNPSDFVLLSYSADKKRGFITLVAVALTHGYRTTPRVHIPGSTCSEQAQNQHSFHIESPPERRRVFLHSPVAHFCGEKRNTIK